MTAARANMAAHLVHTTDSASRRLSQPERSAWPAYGMATLLAVCGFFAVVWPAVSMVWR